MRIPATLILVAGCAFSQWVATPEGGESMFPADSITALRQIGAPGRTELVSVEGMPFERAMRVTVSGTLRNAWDVQVLGTTTGDVRQGDVVWLSLYARGSGKTETGEATGIAYLQRASGDNAKLVGMPFSVGSEWKQFMLPATAGFALPAGTHNYTIFLGLTEQTIEIGGVTLVNFRNLKTVAELPRTKITWAGSEPDAEWRKTASEQIDKLRKADLNVRVRDASGRAVSGAEVRVKMKRHEFGFGTAVAADGIFSTAPDSDAYREVISTWFNKIVLENDLKWPQWEQNRNRALNALQWLRENGQPSVRGHTLIWPGWSRMPADVQRLADDPARLRARVLDHFSNILGATSGQLVEWDVLNEPYTNTDVQKILGEEEMATWFKKARELAPDALLYINDYSILSGGGTDRAHQDHYFQTIGKLIEWGAPLDGIGMQGHFGAQLTPATRVWQILDRFAVYGKKIQVTEFDIDIEDEQVQAAYTRDFLTALFAHPSIDGFMMWGFWEGRHWRPRGAMFRRDWSVKPNGTAYYDLVFGTWWTDERGTTNTDGVFAVRGFKGEYEVEVSRGGRSVTRPAKLSAGGATLDVVIE